MDGEDPLEEETATHSSILAWETPQTEEPGRLQSMGLQKNWTHLSDYTTKVQTPWTASYQAPPSMGFSRQECWSGLPFLSPGDLPYPGIKPGSPALQADALLSKPPEKPYFHFLSL